jgi:putative DNA primase/helicase
MSTPSEILASHGIAPGGHKLAYTTICPQCSHARRKKRDRCLSVLIDGRGVRWNCHHCGWKGYEFYDSNRRGETSMPAVVISPDDGKERRIQTARHIWRATVPLDGTLGERYFIEHRKIDISGLALDHVLRWHPGDRMVVAKMTNSETNKATGIHRTFLAMDGTKLGRKMLGPAGVIRLWPDDAVEQGLVIGEGIETTLAAAVGMMIDGTLLQPAWAAGSKQAIAGFPVLSGIDALTILVDDDAAGYAAAQECALRWAKAGREVVRLVPLHNDFNDILGEVS